MLFRSHVGSTIAADNVIKPGNPPYLQYVRSDVEAKKRELLARAPQGENSNESDGISGDPDLIYESQLIHSFEPTGIPVSFYAACSISHTKTIIIGRS